jgi:hypothetical protein
MTHKEAKVNKKLKKFIVVVWHCIGMVSIYLIILMFGEPI